MYSLSFNSFKVLIGFTLAKATLTTLSLCVFHTPVFADSSYKDNSPRFNEYLRKANQFTNILKKDAKAHNNLSLKLTLNEIKANILTNNPKLISTKFLIDSSFSDLAANTSEFWPSIAISSANISFSSENSNSNTYESVYEGFISNNNTSIDNTFTASITPSIAFPIYNPTLFAKRSVLYSKIDSSKLLYQVEVLNLLDTITDKYYLMDSRRRLINSYIQFIDDMYFTLTASVERYNAGFASILDVEQIYSEYLSYLNTIKNTQNLYSNLSAYFYSINPSYSVNFLYVVPPDSTGIVDVDEFQWSYTLSETIDLAKSYNKRLLLSKSRANEIENELKIISSNLLPSFAASISYPLNQSNEFTSNKRRSSVSSASSKFYSYTNSSSPTIGVNFSWKIFDSLATQNTYKSYQAKLNSSLSATENLEDDLIATIKDKFNNYMLSKSLVGVSIQSYEASDLAFKAASARYLAGVGSLSDFSTAAANRVEAAAQLSNQYAFIISNYYTLYKLIGVSGDSNLDDQLNLMVTF